MFGKGNSRAGQFQTNFKQKQKKFIYWFFSLFQFPILNLPHSKSKRRGFQNNFYYSVPYLICNPGMYYMMLVYCRMGDGSLDLPAIGKNQSFSSSKWVMLVEVH